ncbi:hypothetical protein ACQY0O_001750 [Thecaphora frezii]
MMVSIRTLFLASVAFVALVNALTLPVPLPPPLPPILGGGGNGDLPIHLPGIGSSPGGRDGVVDGAGEVARDGAVTAASEKRTNTHTHAPCVYSGPDKELQKKQICYLGQNGFVPAVAKACESLGPVSQTEAQLKEVVYPASNGKCASANMSADCKIYKQWLWDVLRIDLSILSCWHIGN